MAKIKKFSNPPTGAAEILTDGKFDQVVVLGWRADFPEKLSISVAGLTSTHLKGAQRFAREMQKYLKPVLSAGRKTANPPQHD